MAGIEADTFHNPDDAHTEYVNNFFEKLYASGEIVKKRKRVLIDSVTKEVVFESFLRGVCPICRADTAGAICETCGHPNDAETLLEPRSSLAPANKLISSELEILVLELERFREKIRGFYEDKWASWRPHLLQLVAELLENPLPDYPITYASDWGLPVKFADLEGQVLNVWAEMYPGLMHAAEIVTRQRGEAVDGIDQAKDNCVVQFLGYDNSFFFAIVHVALAFASGSGFRPNCILTNEFYEYENFKFSTSKRNLIWARDLLRDKNQDHVRFYLALSNPEYQKMNFTQLSMERLVHARLVKPWRALTSLIAEVSDTVRITHGTEVALESGQIDQLIEMKRRIVRFYEIENFSMQRAAEHISAIILSCADSLRLARERADAKLAASTAAFAYAAAVSVVPTVAFPLMPRFSGAIRATSNLGPIVRWDNAAELRMLQWSNVRSLTSLI
ncbi:hypothetical protein ATN79_03540 [Paraburkholderia caribensis]|nr:hypothetical protein ATN79_03540 [Paraburkholderia caribensis]